MRIDVHHHFEAGEVQRLFEPVHAKLDRLLAKETRMSKELDDLTAQVAANKTVLGGAVTLINGIADRIAAAGTDPVALAALTADLKSQDEELGAAVLAQTPAAAVEPPAATV